MQSGIAHRRGGLAVVGILLGAVLAGVLIPFYVSAIGEGVAKALAMPALLLLALILLYDRVMLLLLIMLFRASGDAFFVTSQFSLGGYHTSLGGVINAFVVILVLLLVFEKPGTVPRKAIAAWAGFMVAMAIGVAISPVRGEAIRVFLAVLSYFAVFVGAFYVVRSPADFRSCVRVIVWSSVIPAAYAFVELATGGGYGFGYGLRLKATFTHPNIFAFYLVLVISLSLYLMKGGDKLRSVEARIALSLYMLVLLSLLLMTQTRSAWAACFALFAIYSLIFERRYLVYLALVPVVALCIPSVQDRLLDLGAGNEYVQYANLNSFAWRKLIWETGLRWMSPAHYLFGYGLESFRNYSAAFFPLASTTGYGSGAHNVYVECIFELGIVGLFAFLWLFGRVLFMLRPLFAMERLAGFIAIAAVVVYMVVCFSDNMLGYLSFNWYFWFFVGAAMALATTNRQRRDVGNRPAGVSPEYRAGQMRRA